MRVLGFAGADAGGPEEEEEGEGPRRVTVAGTCG